MTSSYLAPDSESWKGRPSPDKSYLHENIRLLDLSGRKIPKQESRTPVLLGYACDEGVARNLGRPGAKNGPKALRGALGKMLTPFRMGMGGPTFVSSRMVPNGCEPFDPEWLFQHWDRGRPRHRLCAFSRSVQGQGP